MTRRDTLERSAERALPLGYARCKTNHPRFTVADLDYEMLLFLNNERRLLCLDCMDPFESLFPFVCVQPVRKGVSFEVLSVSTFLWGLQDAQWPENQQIFDAFRFGIRVLLALDDPLLDYDTLWKNVQNQNLPTQSTDNGRFLQLLSVDVALSGLCNLIGRKYCFSLLMTFSQDRKRVPVRKAMVSYRRTGRCEFRGR